MARWNLKAMRTDELSDFGAPGEMSDGMQETEPGQIVRNEEKALPYPNPNFKIGEITNSLQILKRNGGDDGTRTRGLCRDRAATGRK